MRKTILNESIIYTMKGGHGAITRFNIGQREDGGISYSVKSFHSVKLSRRAFVLTKTGSNSVMETFSDSNDLRDCLADISSPVKDSEIYFINVSNKELIDAILEINKNNIMIPNNMNFPDFIDFCLKQNVFDSDLFLKKVN